MLVSLFAAHLLSGLALAAPAAAAATPPAAPAPTEAATSSDTEAEAAKPAPAEKAPARARDPNASLPFRLGLFYGHAFGQSGDLTRYISGGGASTFQLPSPAAFGLDLGIGLNSHIRYHFGVALEWEGQTGYASKGFRFDPVGLGFPIPVWSNESVAIHIEPIVHLIRGEVLFQSQPTTPNSSLFRIESGIAAAITVVTHHWFFGLEPFALDFRVFEANNQWVHTGFTHLFWFQLHAGYEF